MVVVTVDVDEDGGVGGGSDVKMCDDLKQTERQSQLSINVICARHT